jgi:hypothetical protein
MLIRPVFDCFEKHLKSKLPPPPLWRFGCQALTSLIKSYFCFIKWSSKQIIFFLYFFFIALNIVSATMVQFFQMFSVHFFLYFVFKYFCNNIFIALILSFFMFSKFDKSENHNSFNNDNGSNNIKKYKNNYYFKYKAICETGLYQFFKHYWTWLMSVLY